MADKKEVCPFVEPFFGMAEKELCLVEKRFKKTQRSARARVCVYETNNQ